MHVIRIYHSPEEAYTALSLLQAYGKDAKILDSATLSVLPLDSVALGGYRLAVPEHQVNEAMELLTSPPQGDDSPETRQYFGDEFAQYNDVQDTDQENNPAPNLPFGKIALGGILLIFIIVIISGAWVDGMDWLF